MGNCIYCGKSAGFLKNSHKECEQKYLDAQRQISALIVTSTRDGRSMDWLDDAIQSAAQQGYVSQEAIHELVIKGWEQSVDDVLSDGLLTSEEEASLVHVKERFDLTQDELNANSAYTRVAQAGVLRELAAGNVPTRVQVEGNVFNFQKSEQLVWFFNDVNYYKQTTTRSYQGSSLGFSFRIMKGVYYRPSVYSGHPIDRNNLALIDTGMLAITDKHMYFGGPLKSFRLAYSKFVAFQPLSDAIGFQRDTANAKMEYFECGDGWFIHNLVTNLAQL